MNILDGLIDRWAKEAMDDLGEKGWREIDPNSMMLIIFAVQKSWDRALVKNITRPIWWLITTVALGVISLIAARLLG